MAASNFPDRIAIWQGIENLRKVLVDLMTHGVKNINQATLDNLFPAYGFELFDSKKDLILNQIKQELEKTDLDSETRNKLVIQKSQIEVLDDELIIKRRTDKFSYEYVLKDIVKGGRQVNLAGFIKITAMDNPTHRALVSWQQEHRDPVIFLVELMPGAKDEKIYFHINLGAKDGTAVIEELDEKYMWTHVQGYDYPDMMQAIQNDGYGSVSMNKENYMVTLEDTNIAAAIALEKAETKSQNGESIFQNNVTLMKMYKNDLQDLDFNY